MRMSESSASYATAARCRRTATASNSIGRLRRTRRSPGGSGQRLGGGHGIRRLLTLGLGRGLRVRRRSHVIARGACLGLAAARHALPHAALGFILLGIAIWRSGLLPRWAGLILAIAGPLYCIGPGFVPHNSLLLNLLVYGPFAIASLWLGISILNQSERQQTPISVHAGQTS